MNAAKIKLTPKQAYVFLAVVRRGYTSHTAVAKSLVGKGLLHASMGSYDRTEWGQTVASLPTYTLTEAGVAVAESRGSELRSLAASCSRG